MMAADLLTFGGTQIGDACLRATIEVHRGQGGSADTAAMRQYALLDDSSPNLYYLLRVYITKSCNDWVALARWASTMGALMRKGKQTAQITGDSGTVTLEDAVLVGPFAVPVDLEKHPGKVPSMEVVFIGVTPPG